MQGLKPRKKRGGATAWVFVAIFLFDLVLSGCFPANHSEPPALKIDNGPPALKIVLGENTFTLMRNGFNWPSGSEMRQVDENPYIPLVGDIIPVQLGETLDFRVEGSKDAPMSCTMSLFRHQDVFDSGFVNRKPIFSGEVTKFLRNKDGYTFSWKLPDITALGADGGAHSGDELPRFDLHAELKWPLDSRREVKYAGILISPEKRALDAALNLCASFSKNAWLGKKDALSAFFHPNVLSALERGNPYFSEPKFSPLGAFLESSWDLLLWKSKVYNFKLQTTPRVKLSDWSPYSKTKGPCQVEVCFQVEATDRKSGAKTLWDVTETYMLENLSTQGDNAKWIVWSGNRTSIPREFAADNYRSSAKDLGWTVASSAESKGAQTVISLGDFQSVQNVFLSDDKRFFAFSAENFTRKEIWTIGADGKGLKRLLSVEPLASEGIQISQVALGLLGWVPKENKIRFIVSGHQTLGLHKEEYGHWIGQVDAEKGSIEDIAFIPIRFPHSPYAFQPKDVSVTKDGMAVIFRSGQDLWKVDFQAKKATMLFENIRPQGYDLFRVRYSPSGWYGAFQKGTPGDREIVVYDLKTGEKTTIRVPFRGREVFFAGWTPGDNIAVVIADEKEVVHGIDSDWPVGAKMVRFYSPKGELLYEIFAEKDSQREKEQSIGHWVFSPNEEILFFTKGKVVNYGLNQLGVSELKHETHEIWVWEDPIEGYKESAGPRKLSDVLGTVDSMEYDLRENKVRVFWYEKDSEGAESQSGVSLALDGKVTEVSRPNPRNWGLDRDIFIGAIGEKQYFKRESSQACSIFTLDKTGQKTVLLEANGLIRTGVSENYLYVITDRSDHAVIPSRCTLYLLVP